MSGGFIIRRGAVSGTRAVASGPEPGRALSAQEAGLMAGSGRKGSSGQWSYGLLPRQAMSSLSPGCARHQLDGNTDSCPGGGDSKGGHHEIEETRSTYSTYPPGNLELVWPDLEPTWASGPAQAATPDSSSPGVGGERKSTSDQVGSGGDRCGSSVFGLHFAHR